MSSTRPERADPFSTRESLLRRVAGGDDQTSCANLKDCQLFDLYVLRDRPVREVARIFHVSAGRVYLAKHRIGRLLKKEIERLQKAEP